MYSHQSLNFSARRENDWIAFIFIRIFLAVNILKKVLCVNTEI